LAQPSARRASLDDEHDRKPPLAPAL
jgi:hypothetical protein